MAMKSDIADTIKKKRGPKKGSKQMKPRMGSLAAMEMKKGRKSEKSVGAAMGRQKFF